MKKKGFTLVELIGVIVILAIIALIAIPITLGVVGNAKKQSFIRTLDNSIAAFKIVIADNNIMGNTIGRLDITSDDLKLDNNNFISGEISIDENGEIKLENVSDGEFCANGTKNNYTIKKGDCSSTDETPPIITNISVISTNNSIQVIVSAKDTECGIDKYEYSLDGKNFKEVDSVFTIDGLDRGIEYTITIRVTNNNGETVTKVIKRYTANIEAPIIKSEPAEWSSNKTVTITFPDGEYKYYYSVNGEDFIETTDKVVVLELDSKSYVVIKIVDKDGNYQITTTNITKIDKEIPTCTILVENENSWSTNKKLTVTGKDDGEVYGIKLPEADNYVVNNKAIYTATKNGIYVATVKDKYGNTNTCSANVSKIDNTTPENITATIKAKDGNKITVIAGAIDLESGINKYEFSINGSEYELGNNDTYTFTKKTDNDTVKVKVTNNANLSATYEFKVNDIGTIPTYNVTPTGWSRKKVVTITYPGVNNYVYQYKVNDNEWVTTTKNIETVEFNKNGYVVARMVDGSKVYSAGVYNVNHIDITEPTNIELTVVSKTEKEIKVSATAKDNETGIAKYEFKIDDKDYVVSKDNTFVFEGVTPSIHKVKVRVTNGVGLVSESNEFNVTPKIDTKPKYVIEPSDWSITKTVKITFKEGFKNYYKIDDGDFIEAKNIVTVLPLNKNAKIVAKTTDGQNELDIVTIDVNTIDSEDPVCTIQTTSSEEWVTSRELTITAADKDSGVFGILLPNEEDYIKTESTNKVVDKIGTYEVKVKDNAGRIGKCTLKIEKIDSTKPTNVTVALQSTTKTSMTVQANAVDNESGIVKYEFAIDGGEFINNDKNKTYTFKDVSYQKHKVKIRVTNGSGLVKESDEVEMVPGEKVLPTFTISSSDWAQSKTVTIKYPERQDNYKYEYSKNGGEWVTVEVGVIENVIFTANGYIVGRISDELNTYTTTTYNVNKIDTTAPIVTAKESDKSTNSVTIEAVAKDSESGVVKYEFKIDDGSYIDNSNNKLYTFTGVAKGTHKVTVRVTNKVGLSTESAEITVSPSSIQAPEVNIPNDWSSKKDVTITFLDGFLNYYSVNDGEWIQSTENVKVVEFTEPGTLKLKVSDGLNELITDYITVDGIDLDDPSCNINIENPNEWTSSKKLTIIGTDSSSGIYGIKLEGEEDFVAGWTRIYEAPVDGEYKATVKDNVGRTGTCVVTVTNIDPTGPTSVAATLDSKTTNTLTIKATGVDNESGIVKYEFKIDGDEYIDNGSNDTYTFEGISSGDHNVYVRITNKVGLSTESEPLVVAPNPVTLAEVIITPTGWAQSKTVIINYPNGFINSYNVNGTGWITTDDTQKVIPFTENGYIITRVSDGINVAETTTMNITMIDTTLPTCEMEVINPNSWSTSKQIKITANDDESGVSKIKLPLTNTFVEYEEKIITVDEVGTYTTEVEDASGRTNSCSVTVSHIDTSAPTNVTAALSERTTSTLTIEANAVEDETEITKYEFKIDDGEFIDNGNNKLYTFTNVQVGNHQITVRVTNTVNLQATGTIDTSVLDLTEPVITFPTEWQTSKVATITFPVREDGFIYSYKKNDGEWQVLDTGVIKTVEFDTEGVLHAMIFDGTNTKTVSKDITNIDTDAPTNVVANVISKTTNTLTIKATGTDTESNIVKYEFKIDNGAYIDNGSNDTYTFENVTKESHNIYVRVTDGVGYRTASEATVAEPNAITKPTFEIDNEGWAQSKTVTIKYAEGDEFTKQYSLDGEHWTTVDITEYEVTFDTNGYVVARIFDGTNYSEESTKNVTMIDTTLPTCEITQANLGTWVSKETLTVVADDSESGVFGIKVPGSDYQEGVQTSFEVSANGEYEAIVKDKVGRTNTCSIVISNVDETPATNITLVQTSQTTNTVTVEVGAVDNETGISGYEVNIDNTGFETVTGTTYTFTNVKTGNHSVVIRVTNGVGLTSTETVVISPDTVSVPTYIVDESDWALNKTVTITYPARQDGFIYEYNKDGNGWETVSGLTQNVSFDANGYVIARIFDGTNYFTAATYNVNKIDTSTPTCEIVISNENSWKSSKILTVTASDSESQVYGIKKPGDTDYTVGSTVTYTATANGEYSFTVKDNVGKTNTCSANVSMIDTSAPQNVTLSLTTRNDKTVTVTATGSDGQSGIKNYSFSVDNGSFVSNGTNPSYQVTLTPGDHTIKVRVTNGADLYTDSSNLSVYIPNIRDIEFADDLSGKTVYFDFDLYPTDGREPYFNYFFTVAATQNHLFRLVESVDANDDYTQGTNYVEVALVDKNYNTVKLLYRKSRYCTITTNQYYEAVYNCNAWTYSTNLTEYTMPSNTGAVTSPMEMVKVDGNKVTKKSYTLRSLEVGQEITAGPLVLSFPNSFSMTAAQTEADFLTLKDANGSYDNVMFGIFASIDDWREYGGDYAFTVMASYPMGTTALFYKDLATNTLISNQKYHTIEHDPLYISAVNKNNKMYSYIKTAIFN